MAEVTATARRGAPNPKHLERVAIAKNALAALDAGQALTVPYQRPPRAGGRPPARKRAKRQRQPEPLAAKTPRASARK